MPISRIARRVGRVVWGTSLLIVVLDTPFSNIRWRMFPAPVFYGAFVIFLVGLWQVWSDLVAARRLGRARVVERELELQRVVDSPMPPNGEGVSRHVT